MHLQITMSQLCKWPETLPVIRVRYNQSINMVDIDMPPLHIIENILMDRDERPNIGIYRFRNGSDRIGIDQCGGNQRGKCIEICISMR